MRLSLFYMFFVCSANLISLGYIEAQDINNRIIYVDRDFGAVADGKSLSTQAFQQAIDTCSHSGGREVVVPPGKFLSGTLYMKSSVFLRLEKGAVLLGSTDMNDYSPRVLIRATKQSNFGIIGK